MPAPNLKEIPVRKIMAAIEKTAMRFLDPRSAERMTAVRDVAEESGFSEPMVRQALDWTFSEMTVGQMRRILVSELGSDDAADDPRLQSPSLVFLSAAGSIFQPAIYGIVYALLVKSPVIVKCSSHDRRMPPLFVKILRDVDADVGRAAEAAYWPGRERDDLMAKADAVVAFGSDETIADIRARISGGTKFIGHGHKISVAVVGVGSLKSVPDAQSTAANLAVDIAMYDQSGCLSPQNVWIETGGEVSCGQFARMLSEELALLADAMPLGKLSADHAAAILAFRSEFEYRCAQDASGAGRVGVGDAASAGVSDAGRCYFGDRLSYSVIVDPDPSFCPTPLGRTVMVKPMRQRDEWAGCLSNAAGHLQGVGAAPVQDFRDVFEDCRNLGANYFCEIGRMQRPPIAWQNGGVSCLRSLLKTPGSIV